MEESDTIAAIATPLGNAGVGVIRISGPQVEHISKQILGKTLKPRYAAFCHFYQKNGEIIDSGLALYFPHPHSFTGEDILELQGHGGLIMKVLLNRVLQCGARLAHPGEFSQRAFLNGKIDLAQAEAIADLIEARTEQAALSASRSLQGVFSKKINTLAQELMQLRLFVEASIDFVEEEIDFLSEQKIFQKLTALMEALKVLQLQAQQGKLLKEGMRVAIVGQPNAGKSSLLNCLTQADSAIVTPIAGTTRDVIKETIHLDGLAVQLVDTAGIRNAADEIEQEGIHRTEQQQQLADRILLVRDGRYPLSEMEESILQAYPDKVTQVINKIDLTKDKVGWQGNKIFISVKNLQGIEILKNHLKQCMGFQGEEGNFIARIRHLEALKQAQYHCQQAQQQWINKASELLAQELLFAQQALGAIVGKVSSEDLLGEIFSSFCIGK